MPKVSIKKLREIEWAGDNCGCECCPVCGGIDPRNMPKDLRPLKEGVVYGHQNVIDPDSEVPENCWLGKACYEGNG